MLLIKNGRINTMAGSELENGCVLIGDDGKIVSVNASKGATVESGTLLCVIQ